MMRQKLEEDLVPGAKLSGLAPAGVISVGTVVGDAVMAVAAVGWSRRREPAEYLDTAANCVCALLG